ncbi:hypothetical protein [Streptomyces sp.]|uniref:hypothetical protein n=1 Tax=Streptomyces sp. TaxID=1931 RepID=UPI00281225AD|nr:hypothetical protein [Streptomyces sp.]
MTDHSARPSASASSPHDSLAELHAQCRSDYEQAAATRAAAAGAARDQLALGRAHAAEGGGRR